LSHPYFWSSLVIYGDDEPVYPNKKLFYIIAASLMLAGLLLIAYFLKRRYS